MKEINTEITIDSTPDQIWKTLMNLEQWATWNPIVNGIKGNLNVGGELAITMSDTKGNDSKKYNATITALKTNERFTFVATMLAKFMFSAERIIELEPTDNGTVLIQREVYKGLMASLFWGKLKTEATEMLISMNKALKQEVEKQNQE